MYIRRWRHTRGQGSDLEKIHGSLKVVPDVPPRPAADASQCVVRAASCSGSLAADTQQYTRALVTSGKIHGVKTQLHRLEPR